MIKFKEFLSSNKNSPIIGEFTQFAASYLKLESVPKIDFSEDTKKAQELKTFGYTTPSNSSIWVYTKNRNLADILRTLAHEMVHVQQVQLGKIHADSGVTGSEHENEANSVAGVLLRNFAGTNNQIFEEVIT